jgi:hypothetical protein
MSTSVIKILILARSFNQDFHNTRRHCLLHPSAVISVRSNVCLRPENGYNMSKLVLIK